MKIGPLSLAGPGWWTYMYRSRNYFGIFRNRPGIKPGRWGFYLLGLEFGSRQAGNPFGAWLKRVGLWPW